MFLLTATMHQHGLKCRHKQRHKCVQAELKMLGITNIGMHHLSPGMVTTDLLMSGMLLFVTVPRSLAVHMTLGQGACVLG